MRTDAAEQVHSYFICATPRTGSSLLLGCWSRLGSLAGRRRISVRLTSRCGLTGGRSRALIRAVSSYVDYVQAALAAGRTENCVFGAKLMWGTLDEVVAKLGEVYPHPPPRPLRMRCIPGSGCCCRSGRPAPNSCWRDGR
ncbi:Stf0 family sulfotransferase [Streptomyces chartreusis]